MHHVGHVRDPLPMRLAGAQITHTAADTHQVRVIHLVQVNQALLPVFPPRHTSDVPEPGTLVERRDLGHLPPLHAGLVQAPHADGGPALLPHVGAVLHLEQRASARGQVEVVVLGRRRPRGVRDRQAGPRAPLGLVRGHLVGEVEPPGVHQELAVVHRPVARLLEWRRQAGDVGPPVGGRVVELRGAQAAPRQALAPRHHQLAAGVGSSGPARRGQHAHGGGVPGVVHGRQLAPRVGHRVVHQRGRRRVPAADEVDESPGRHHRVVRAAGQRRRRPHHVRLVEDGVVGHHRRRLARGRRLRPEYVHPRLVVARGRPQTQEGRRQQKRAPPLAHQPHPDEHPPREPHQAQFQHVRRQRLVHAAASAAAAAGHGGHGGGR